MKLEKKLSLWENKNLISSEQKQQILDFEKNRKNPMLFNALLLLGVFWIALGIISLVAANWVAIPDGAKLGLDLIILCAVAYGTFGAWKSGKTIWFEGGMLALFMLVGASIGLIGQVFQLNGSLASAGLFWAFMTLPLLVISKRKVLSFFWLPLLVFSVFSFESVLELLIRIFDWWWWEKNPEAVLLLVLIFTGILAGFFAMLDNLTKKEYPVFGVAKLYSYIIMYGAVIEFMFLGTTFSRMHFFNIYLVVTAFLLVMAFVAEKLGRRRLVNLNISMLYLDFMCIYFNLFGSLATTGLGFIISGAVLIGGLYLTRNIIRKLKTLK